MTADYSFIDLILNASLVVQLVMLILVVASVVSWTMIFNKRLLLKHSKNDADMFEERFWSSEDLSPLYNRITAGRYESSGMEKIFGAGYKEFSRLQKQESIDPEAVLDGAQRSMRIAMNKEVDHLETNLSFLATVGSTSPYIGLFGTVWGIMNSFQALGTVQQATISMVAPGISEALVATAMGLFAAIPAVIAYNRYSNDVERLINRYDNFLEEFSSILHRHAHS
jgi:biopolymer transport protein TolQ|tara:strand:+ start:799 stop:1473 length:675 start_codon:yes stop_codon:yes gene_type:complete